MAIDPKHAEATADAKPDTAQADAAVESNRDPLVKGWTFAEIGRQYSAADDVSDVPVEFWVALGMDKFCDPAVQLARLVCHAHALNLFHLKGKAGDPERATELAGAMGTNVDTLYRLIDQAVNTWGPMERKLDTILKEAGGYEHSICDPGDIDMEPLGNLDPDGDHSDLPFSEGDELDVEATIKAVDETLDKEEEGEIDSK